MAAAAGLEGLPRAPAATHGLPPQQAAPARVDFVPFLDQEVSRRDPPEVRKAAYEATVRRLPDAELEMFTDGTAHSSVITAGH